MAKRRRFSAASHLPLAPWQLPVAALALLLAPASHAALKFTPGVALSEIYSDNVALAPSGQEKSQFITDFAPSFSVTDDTPRLKLSASVVQHLYLYSDKQIANTNRSTRDLNADMRAKVIEDLLFFDASASRAPQSVSAFGPQASSSNGYASTNRSDVTTWRVTPYIQHRIGTTAVVMLRYTRDSVDAGNSGMGSSKGDAVTANLVSGPSFRVVGWNLDYNKQNLQDSITAKSSVETAHGGLQYRATTELRLTSSVGYDRYQFGGPGGEQRGKNWSVGFNWTPSLRSQLQASGGKSTYGNTYALLATHRSRHTVWRITYDDAVTTTRGQFMLPASVNTASMLDGLFTPQYPDPVARAQAVAAYMAASGLPATLTQSVNYFSNRYMLQKQFMASVAFNGAHSNALLSAFSTRRRGLSSQQQDSGLLVNQVSSLNDNTNQVGVSANYTYQLSLRSALTASATVARAKSDTADQTDNSKTVRLGLTRQLGRKTQFVADVHQVRGSTGYFSGAAYRENAVSATISTKF
jgi:uncharacterized protein (PEP-CTERM system associated)